MVFYHLTILYFFTFVSGFSGMKRICLLRNILYETWISSYPPAALFTWQLNSADFQLEPTWVMTVRASKCKYFLNQWTHHNLALSGCTNDSQHSLVRTFLLGEGDSISKGFMCKNTQSLVQIPCAQTYRFTAPLQKDLCSRGEIPTLLWVYTCVQEHTHQVQCFGFLASPIVPWQSVINGPLCICPQACVCVCVWV